MRRYSWLLGIVLIAFLHVGFHPGGLADQPDFPLIYIDAGCAGTHVGSAANPYDDLSDINWTTGGDNSIFDYLAGSPSQSPTIYLNKGDIWREQLTVGCSGTATYPIIIGAYGTGADPIINGSDIIGTWTQSYTSTGGTYYPAANADDTYVKHTSQSTNDVDYGYMGLLTESRGAGVRFTNVTVAKDATIDTAYVTYTAYQNAGVTTCNLVLSGEDSATPAQFSTYADYNGRSTTTATVDWDAVGAWTNEATYNTPSIVSIIEEITTLGGWSSGNNLVIFCEDNSSGAGAFRVMSQYNLGPGSELASLYIGSQVADTNVWQATVTTEPTVVVFDGTKGTNVANKAAVNGANEWFWDSNVLYIYYTEDPDGAVVIEASQRGQNVKIQDKDYITVDGLDLKYAINYGVYAYDNSTYINVDNCTAQKNGRIGVNFESSTNCGTDTTIAHNNDIVGIQFITNSTPGTVTSCTSYSNSEEGFTAEAGSDSITYTLCTSYSNGKSGFSTSDVIGIVYNRCISYENGTITAASGNGFAVWDDESVGSQAYYHYCIAYSNKNCGIEVTHALASPSETRIYNCAFWDNDGYHIRLHSDDVIMKNCILHTAGYNKEIKVNAAITPTLANNCYYDSDASTTCEFQGSDYTSKATWEAASGETGSVWADPLMSDPANDDFTLQKTSPCINAGTGVGLTQDYGGTLVPKGSAPDIGAYEYFKAIIMGMLRWQL